jgi:prepilin-type processing-associated H-X9-DG protein
MPRMDSIQNLAADIAPYIGYSTKLFVCPSDTAIRPAGDIGNQPPPGPTLHAVTASRPANNISNLTESSYAIVTNAVWGSTPPTPMLFDKMHATGLTVLTGRNSWSRDSAHKDGGNVLWTDGHVDWNKALDVGTNRYPVVND